MSDAKQDRNLKQPLISDTFLEQPNNENTRDSIDPNEEKTTENPKRRQTTARSSSIVMRLFGCCLERSLISRGNTNGPIDSGEDDDDATTFPINSSPQLKFNQSQNKKSQNVINPHQMSSPQMINPSMNKQMTKNQQQGSTNSNVYRQSAMESKTHNFDFDISNFNMDQVFLFGKQLLLIVHVREQKHVVSFEKERQFEDITTTGIKEKQLNNNNLLHIYFPGYENVTTVDHSSKNHLVPDCIVSHIARKAASSSRRESLIDAACGIGQFSIAFARHFESVISIESDESRCECAKTNVKLYGLPSRNYCQANRVAAGEGILFFQQADFIDDSFEIKSNRSDCIFLASHLMPKYVDFVSIGQSKDSYFESNEYYSDLTIMLKKAFALAPQVILFTPRNVRISEICEAFTEGIKENLSKVKRCSLQIEKHMVNGHLKHICFYFGEFNRSELSSQEEFKFINSYLEKCNKYLLPKSKPSVSPPSQKQTPLRIHPQIFTELGKFQVLNIVEKFHGSFKLLNTKPPQIPPQESLNSFLLSIFYEYLITHGLISSQRIQQIILMKSSTNFSRSGTGNQMNISSSSSATMISPKHQLNMNQQQQQQTQQLISQEDDPSKYIQYRHTSSGLTFPSRTQSNAFSSEEGVVACSLGTQDIITSKNGLDRTMTDQSGSWTGHSYKPSQLQLMPELRTTTINYSYANNTYLQEFMDERAQSAEADKVITKKGGKENNNNNNKKPIIEFDDQMFSAGSATESGTEEENEDADEDCEEAKENNNNEIGGKEGLSEQFYRSSWKQRQLDLVRNQSINSNGQSIVFSEKLQSKKSVKRQRQTLKQVPNLKNGLGSSSVLLFANAKMSSASPATSSSQTTIEKPIVFNFNFFQLSPDENSFSTSQILM